MKIFEGIEISQILVLKHIYAHFTEIIWFYYIEGKLILFDLPDSQLNENILQPAYPSVVCFGDGVQAEALCGGTLHPVAEGHHIWQASWQGYNQLVCLVDLFSQKKDQ